MLVGLIAKNAILIVEFARQQRTEGKSIVEASIEAAHLRLRPILMTSFAFILGVVPLVLSSGAGAASRVSLGTAVFGGMLVGTFLAVFVVPSLYVVFQRLSEWRQPVAAEAGRRPSCTRRTAPTMPRDCRQGWLREPGQRILSRIQGSDDDGN
jgi:hypothetical protein